MSKYFKVTAKDKTKAKKKPEEGDGGQSLYEREKEKYEL